MEAKTEEFFPKKNYYIKAAARGTWDTVPLTVLWDVRCIPWVLDPLCLAFNNSTQDAVNLNWSLFASCPPPFPPPLPSRSMCPFHWIINYIETKAKCRHPKKIYLSRDFALIDWRYRKSSWYFLPRFVNCCPSNLLSGSSLPPPPLSFVNRYTAYK